MTITDMTIVPLGLDKVLSNLQTSMEVVTYIVPRLNDVRAFDFPYPRMDEALRTLNLPH